MAQALLRRSDVFAVASRNGSRHYMIQAATAASHDQPQLKCCAARSTSAAAAAFCWTRASLGQSLLSSDGGSGRTWQPSVRCISSVSDGGLLKVLKSEIDYEAQQDKSQEVQKIPPKPYTLHDKPGTQEIILRRSYGPENIAITCIYQSDPYADQPEDEDEEGENEEEEDKVASESVSLTVTITKSGEKPALEINCSTSGDGISIERVAYLEDGSDKELFYEGPEFEELDEELQKQFKKFLESRGINEELGQFLMQYMPEKERQEYVRWLKNMEAFVKL